MRKLIPFACLAVLGSSARAAGQDEPTSVQEVRPAASEPATKPGAATVVPQVTISGSRANDTEQRRMSTAAKMIFGREELDRNGDSDLGEILKRLPGVTLGGRPGRGGGARMRGLGNGYTQMLLNGERMPPGFSVESIAPDQVERIEVMRGPVAEHSTQAIAGTINIVLREGYQQRDIQLKLTDSIEQNRHAPNISLAVPGKLDNLSYLLSGSVFQNRQRDRSVTHNLDTDDTDNSGAVLKAQVVTDQSERRTRGIHLTPRLSYRFESGDTLTFQPFLVSTRSNSTSDSMLLQSQGSTAPEYARADATTSSSSTFLRGFGNWLHRMENGAKLDVKFGLRTGRSDSDSLRNQYTDAGVLKDVLTDTNVTRERGANTGGKYSIPLGKGHLLAAGWDAEWGKREQTSSAQNRGLALFSDSGVALAADTRRLAAFVQDEWDITPQWSAYLGLRWEGIRTSSDGSGARAGISNKTSVWSPVLHGVWRIPGHEKDQVRMSLTQSYKAPGLDDLIAAPSLSRTNSATRPDRTGNPSLKPELAKGLDLAYEHYLGKSGILSASGFVRDIDNLIRRETTQDAAYNASTTRRMEDGGLLWVSRPVNVGHARTSGIELEAKFQLVELVPDAPAIDLRANYSRFWSRVDGIPGPDNRLDQQAKQTANVGLDYRMKGLPLTLGGGYNWTPATRVQTSVNEFVTSGVKRQIDLYGLWKLSPQTQLRISANNLLADDAQSSRRFDAGNVAQFSNSEARTFTTWGIRLEMKL